MVDNVGYQWSAENLENIGLSEKFLGAGDENRTRVLSLGRRARMVVERLKRTD
jgi:hypothetical protein